MCRNHRVGTWLPAAQKCYYHYRLKSLVVFVDVLENRWSIA
jgi:hypothetical protein